MNHNNKIKLFYSKMLEHYGPQFWWPSNSKIETIVGAILTQNTTWSNAEKAIKNLKNKSKLTEKELYKIGLDELSNLIRSAGFYNKKAKTIKNFIKFLAERYKLDINNMQLESKETLRVKLLSIKGIGPETADTILLYALDKPSFVIDKYTYRILNRHCLVSEKTNYNEMQKLIATNIEEDTQIYNEFHALIVKIGKEHCKNKAICNKCPLEFDITNR